MKRILILGICAWCVIALQAQPLQRVAPEVLDMNPQHLMEADAAILQAIEDGEIPGAVLAVVHQGKMAYLKAYGDKQVYPTRVPMDVNTVFDLASVSKSISTAISAMILIEQGKLRLLDKVNLYIPNFRGWEDENGEVTDIRVVDLMTHTSGLVPYADLSVVQEKYGSPNPQGLMEYIALQPRAYEPKTKFQYSCINYITLQHIIEYISGQSLKDFAQQHIFDVLEMKNTCYQPEGEILKKVAPTERQEDGSVLTGMVHDPLARIMNGGISGNAGVFSDADDLAILAAALLNNGSYKGKRILSPLGVKAMRTVPREVVTFGRTLGWDIYSPYASNNGDLLGPNTYGHTGYTGTSIVIDPDNDVAIILLANRVHPYDKGNVVRLRSLVANAVAASLHSPQEIVFHPHYYKRLQQFENEAPISSKDIVFIGNSITEGGDWSTLLKKKHIRNRGISGDNTFGIYSRLDEIISGKPKKIFLMAGINDLANEVNIDSIMINLTNIVRRIRTESPKTKIYLQSVLPIDESIGRYKRLAGKSALIPELNTRIEQLSKSEHIRFINLYPLFTAGYSEQLNSDFSTDGLHLNEKGYEVWRKRVK